MAVVSLNVGGARHQVVISTLQKYPETMLAKLINPANSALAVKSDDGSYFFDRNPTLFPFVLDFYRTGRIVFPTIISQEDFLLELQFWGIDAIAETKLKTPQEIIDYGALQATLIFYIGNAAYTETTSRIIDQIYSDLEKDKRTSSWTYFPYSVGHFLRFFRVSNLKVTKMKFDVVGEYNFISYKGQSIRVKSVEIIPTKSDPTPTISILEWDY